MGICEAAGAEMMCETLAERLVGCVDDGFVVDFEDGESGGGERGGRG